MLCPAADGGYVQWDVRAFELFAPCYDALMPSTDEVALRKGLACADRELGQLLEVGGGTGRAAREVDATVLDPARGMLECARDRGLETIQGSATALPHPDASLDAVVIVDAFHHFPDHERCLAEVQRVLAPGGVLVVREFDASTRRGRLLEVAEYLVGFDSRFYSAEELEAAIDAAGLDARPVDYGFGMTVVGIKE